MPREADDEPVHRDRRQLTGESAQERAALRARQASDVDDQRARHHAALVPRGEHAGRPAGIAAAAPRTGGPPPTTGRPTAGRRRRRAALALTDRLEECRGPPRTPPTGRGDVRAPRDAHLEGLALHLGQRRQPVRHGAARGRRAVANGRCVLLLAAGDPHGPDRGPGGHALQQLGLPDPRLAAHDRDPLRPARDEPAQRARAPPPDPTKGGAVVASAAAVIGVPLGGGDTGACVVGGTQDDGRGVRSSAAFRVEPGGFPCAEERLSGRSQECGRKNDRVPSIGHPPLEADARSEST